jgi:hypothetical protein
MKSYSETSGREPDFEVEYRFLSDVEGGRKTPPHQHTRWDYLYEGDSPSEDGIWMIWPEFISLDRKVLPKGEVPLTGRALMFIVNRENVSYHLTRISIGTKGAFVEGAQRVAKCEIVAIHGLVNFIER